MDNPRRLPSDSTSIRNPQRRDFAKDLRDLERPILAVGAGALSLD